MTSFAPRRSVQRLQSPRKNAQILSPAAVQTVTLGLRPFSLRPRPMVKESRPFNTKAPMRPAGLIGLHVAGGVRGDDIHDVSPRGGIGEMDKSRGRATEKPGMPLVSATT